MAIYTDTEILNEASRVFRGQLSPEKNGGSVSLQDEYDQLMEMTSTTFLFNSDAIFYLAQIIVNNC
jgi:hypothetical protein